MFARVRQHGVWQPQDARCKPRISSASQPHQKPVHGTSKATITLQIQQVRPWALGGLETFSNVVWIDSKEVWNTERKIVLEQTTKLITDAKKYGHALIDTCCWLSTHRFTKKHVFDAGCKKGWRWCVVSWIVSGQTSCPFSVANCNKKMRSLLR